MGNPINLYIHVPFCKRRCIYCDFYTLTETKLIPQYLDALLGEIAERLGEVASAVSPLKLGHIYLGGGTPSLLAPEQLSRIFQEISKYAHILEDAEITLEANPDDIHTDYALALKELPINRVSLGAQSFWLEDLEFLGRRHGPEGIAEAVRLIRELAEIDNISIDLIYGLPRQTPERWQYNLDKILEIRPEHISAYHLIYEEGTPLERMRTMGKVEEASDEDSLKLFGILIDRLEEAGYEQYEVSNFALPGKRARLNAGYWDGTPYLGLGPGAHSYDGKALRRANLPKLNRYIQLKGVGKELFLEEELSPIDQKNEYIMIRLRTRDGISLPQAEQRFGTSFRHYLEEVSEPFLKKGLLERIGEQLKPTKEGFFLSDHIIRTLFLTAE